MQLPPTPVRLMHHRLKWLDPPNVLHWTLKLTNLTLQICNHDAGVAVAFDRPAAQGSGARAEMDSRRTRMPFGALKYTYSLVFRVRSSDGRKGEKQWIHAVYHLSPNAASA